MNRHTEIHRRGDKHTDSQIRICRHSEIHTPTDIERDAHRYRQGHRDRHADSDKTHGHRYIFTDTQRDTLLECRQIQRDIQSQRQIYRHRYTQR